MHPVCPGTCLAAYCIDEPLDVTERCQMTIMFIPYIHWKMPCAFSFFLFPVTTALPLFLINMLAGLADLMQKMNFPFTSNDIYNARQAMLNEIFKKKLFNFAYCQFGNTKQVAGVRSGSEAKVEDFHLSTC